MATMRYPWSQVQVHLERFSHTCSMACCLAAQAQNQWNLSEADEILQQEWPVTNEEDNDESVEPRQAMRVRHALQVP
jgi:hypothetical protein